MERRPTLLRSSRAILKVLFRRILGILKILWRPKVSPTKSILLVGVSVTIVCLYYAEPFRQNHFDSKVILSMGHATQIMDTNCNLEDGATTTFMNQDSRLASLVICSPADKSEHHELPRLVLFTSTTYRAEKHNILDSILKLWVALGPTVQPILFLTDPLFLVQSPDTIQMACDLGWMVAKAPACNTALYPVLKSMAIMARQWYPDALWIGYANADIGFDRGLMRTLKFLTDLRIEGKFFSNLVVGQRYETAIHNAILTSPEDVLDLVGNSGQARGHYAIDYFITYSKEFPWQRVPPYVIGRPYYDNGMVCLAHNKSMGIRAVDTTESILAVHLRDMNNPASSHEYKQHKVGSEYNFKWFPTSQCGRKGRTQCLQHKTVDLAHSVFLVCPFQETHYFVRGFKDKIPKRILKLIKKNIISYVKNMTALRLLIQQRLKPKLLETYLVQKRLQTLEVQCNRKMKSNGSTKISKLTPSQKVHSGKDAGALVSADLTFLSQENLDKEIQTKIQLKRQTLPSQLALFRRHLSFADCASITDPRQIPVSFVEFCDDGGKDNI